MHHFAASLDAANAHKMASQDIVARHTEQATSTCRICQLHLPSAINLENSSLHLRKMEVTGSVLVGIITKQIQFIVESAVRGALV
jgi:hypothetical protein